MLEPPQRRLSVKEIITFIESRLTEDCTSPTIVSSEVKKGNLEFSRHNYSIGTDLNLSATMKRCKESKQEGRM